MTEGYKGLQRVTRGYRGLQGVNGGYRGLQGVTGNYRGLQGITNGNTGLQRLQGLQVVTRVYSSANSDRTVINFQQLLSRSDNKKFSLIIVDL